MFTSIVSDLPSTFIGIFSVYTLTSFILFKYPTLLHKKKNIAFLARNISHRGGAGENYENTIVAFRRALHVANSDMLEIDCHITKDGKVVVIHDSNLLRLTGVDKDITTLRYDELPPLKNLIPIDFQPGEYFSDESITDKERMIPLLEDVLINFPHTPINIDIKQKNSMLIEQVSNLIIQHKMEKYCVWGNKSADITEECFKQNPRINLLFSTRKVIEVLLYYYIGLLPFIPLKETHLEVFLPTIYQKWPQWQKHKSLARLLMRTMKTILIRNSLFTHLKQRGIQIYLWVLNEEVEYELAFKAGATAIMTDYPTKLAKFIKKNESAAR